MKLDAILDLVYVFRALGVPNELLEPIRKWAHQVAASTGFIL